MTFRRAPWKGQAGGTERGRKSVLSGTGAPLVLLPGYRGRLTPEPLTAGFEMILEQ